MFWESLLLRWLLGSSTADGRSLPEKFEVAGHKTMDSNTKETGSVQFS